MKLNILDRTVAFFSPGAGLNRARQRAAMETVRSYEAARHSRRTDGWITSGTSAAAEAGPAIARLRANARDMVRNNPYAARAVSIIASNAVGTGIEAKSRTGDVELDKKVDALWKKWAEDECDADGQLDFAGLQHLAVRTIVEGGEVLCRFRPRRAADNMETVPLQLQLLEGDYLDTSRDTSATASGGFVRLGIEFDAIENRSAYWLYRQHPGDATLTSRAGMESVRVPAENIAHIYSKDRQGLPRGVTWFAPVMMRVRDLDEFHEAALVKAKVEACLGVVVTRPDNEDADPIGVERTDENGQPIEGMEPGMVVYTKPGESIEVINPQGHTAYDPYTLQTLMAVASGMGITYDQLTGDLRQASYSSLRAGKIEFRRNMERFQWQTLIKMLCKPTRKRWIAQAIAAGKLPDRKSGYPTEWVAPKFERIDPLKDLKADILEVRAGGMTWDQMVARNGYDPREQLEAIAKHNADLDRLGIVLETDPRRMSAGGQAIPQPETESPD
ncbi:MAG: hypothetical protein VR70_05850 [Rhodospirillaceae bacterium BRH_c57]|nr:MAG: hypothetical protein VR70_05850 [Rhodospirillaceae bacterium BRH_c57]